MKELLRTKQTAPTKLGLLWFEENGNCLIMGKYDGTTFEGTDKLSMAVASDYPKLKQYNVMDKIIVAEGDRFTNGTFIKLFNPYIIKISDDGAKGRKSRGSNQTQRHLKAIVTRVANINEDVTVGNSEQALALLLDMTKRKRV